MKKMLVTVGVPFLVVASATLGIVSWDRGALPGMRPEIVDVTVDTINRDNRGVRITGTAHYEARLKQQSGADTFWLYPLTAKGKITDKTIHVMVRTHIEPDAFYGFEDRTIEGLARPPGRLVPRTAREALLKQDYTFTEDMVLVQEFEAD